MQNKRKKSASFNYIDTGFSAKPFDKETGLYNFPQRYYDCRNVKWMTLDPAGIDLMNPMEQNEDGKMVPKQNYSIVESLNWYNYCGNNPVMYSDPEGLKLIIPDEPQPEGDKYSVEENQRMVLDYLSGISGAEVYIDEDGYVQLGKQIKTGKYWLQARGRLQAIIDSDKEIGITANNNSIDSWGFNPRHSCENVRWNQWADINKLDAWINVKGYTDDKYLSPNPKYRKGFFRNLLKNAPSKYLRLNESVYSASAHEVLGHAYDFVSRGRYWSETSADEGANIYLRAMGKPSKKTKDKR